MPVGRDVGARYSADEGAEYSRAEVGWYREVCLRPNAGGGFLYAFAP